MDQTELKEFKLYCRDSPITVEFLIANQIKYDFVNNHIIQYICSNPKLTVQVFQWLLSNYPDSLLDYFEDEDIGSLNPKLTIQVFELLLSNYPNSIFDYVEDILSSTWNVFPMEKYILLIDHIIKIKGTLYWKFHSGHNILHWTFQQILFDAPMLNWLYQKDHQLDIGCENASEISPLYYMIVKSSRLLELLQVIKSYEPANSRTQIKIKYTNRYYYNSLRCRVNYYARIYSQTILVLIELCGELFSLIDIRYLCQDICNHFYSSKYFQRNPDRESLIKLIPEQFPRKPCRLWRNQFTCCEFSWSKNQTCFESSIRN
jgi:hypothetical protein